MQSVAFRIGRSWRWDPEVIERLGRADAERIDLWRPAKVVDRLGMGRLAMVVDFVDRHHFPLAGLRDQVTVLKAPPGGGVAAETAPLVLRALAGPWQNIADTHLQHVTGLRVVDIDRSGADVDPKPFASAPAQDRGIHRTGAPPIHTLAVCRPVENRLRPRVAIHHTLAVIRGML